MTDHKAEAESFISSTQRMFWDDSMWPEIAAHHASAQVHATLYLAEQQRIANVFATLRWHPGDLGAKLDDLRMGLAGEVWEALGLS